MDEKDTAKKYVWRKSKWYRKGRIAYKACPTCHHQVSYTNPKCLNCNQTIDFSDWHDELTDLQKRRTGNGGA